MKIAGCLLASMVGLVGVSAKADLGPLVPVGGIGLTPYKSWLDVWKAYNDFGNNVAKKTLVTARAGFKQFAGRFQGSPVTSPNGFKGAVNQFNKVRASKMLDYTKFLGVFGLIAKACLSAGPHFAKTLSTNDTKVAVMKLEGCTQQAISIAISYASTIVLKSQQVRD